MMRCCPRSVYRPWSRQRILIWPSHPRTTGDYREYLHTTSLPLLLPEPHVHVPSEPLPQLPLLPLRQPPRQPRPRAHRQVLHPVRRVLARRPRRVPQRPWQVAQRDRVRERARRRLRHGRPAFRGARRVQTRGRERHVLELVFWRMFPRALHTRQIILRENASERRPCNELCN